MEYFFTLFSLIQFILLGLTLSLFILPGYLLVLHLGLNLHSKAEKIFAGFSLSLTIATLTGFLFSFLELFTVRIIGVFFLSISLILIVYHFHQKKIEISLRIPHVSTTSILLWGGFIFAFILAHIFESHSLLPTTWDRGIHFTRMLFLLNHSHLPKVMGAPQYLPYYPEGFNVSVSSFTALYCFLTGFYPEFTQFSSIMFLNKSFTFFNEFFIALNVLGIFTLVREISKERKEAILASLLSLLFIHYTIGSLVSMSSYCFLAFPLLIMYKIAKTSQRKQDLLLPFLGATLVLFRIRVATFFFLLAFFTITFTFLSREITLRRYGQILGLLLASLLLAGGFLYLNHNMLLGILNTYKRKELASLTISKARFPLTLISLSISISPIKAFLLRLLPSLNYIITRFQESLIPDSFFPFLIAGSVIAIKEKKRRAFTLALWFAPWFLDQIPPYGRFGLYKLYLFPILASFGFIRILGLTSNSKSPQIRKRFSKIIKKMKRVKWVYILLLVLLLFPRLKGKVRDSLRPGYYRSISYIGEGAFHKVEMVKAGTSPDAVIVTPTKGPSSVLLCALAEKREILIATPRSDRTPSYVELVKLYSYFKVQGIDHAPENISSSMSRSMISKYNITAILFHRIYNVNVTLYQEMYPKARVFHQQVGGWKLLILS